MPHASRPPTRTALAPVPEPFTPAVRLIHGIARMDRAFIIARETADIAPAPGGEALDEIVQLLAQALILIRGLRGHLKEEL